MHFLWFLILGALAGWLAGVLVKGGGFGIVGDIVVGILGALLGGWLFGVLGIGGSGEIGSFVTAVVGAVVLLLVIRTIKRA